MEIVDFLLVLFSHNLYYQPLESFCLDPAEMLLSIIFECLLQVEKKKTPNQTTQPCDFPPCYQETGLFVFLMNAKECR